MTTARAFRISLGVLLAVHTIVSLVSYRVFTVRSQMPGDGTPVEITTPEQRVAGQTSFRVITGRKFTPVPVLFYICGGFAGLGAAALLWFTLGCGLGDVC